MGFNMHNAYAYICKVVRSHQSITDGMKELLTYCRCNYKSNVWTNIQDMDFECDKADLLEWLMHNLISEPPSEKIDAFFIGLFDGISEDEEVCMLYLSGITCIYDELDNEEWDFESIYLPSNGYIDLKVLNNISTMLKNESGEVLEVGEYVLYLGYVCLVIRDILKVINKKLLVEARDMRKVVVGFDEGDYIILETVRK